MGKYLLEHGYVMIPVNPKVSRSAWTDRAIRISQRHVQRERSTWSIVFAGPHDIGPLADQAIAIGAKTLWMQLGVVNQAAAAKASAAGLDVVMDRCVKIEHGRLFGGLNWAGVNTRVISARRPRQLPY